MGNQLRISLLLGLHRSQDRIIQYNYSLRFVHKFHLDNIVRIATLFCLQIKVIDRIQFHKSVY